MNHLIILAAGQGQRLKSKSDKMLVEVAEKPLIYYTISSFQDHPEIHSITIVASKSNKTEINKVIKEYNFDKVKTLILGGKTRQESLSKGFEKLPAPSKDDVILVHNGANPLPSIEEIGECIEKCQEVGACIVGHSLSSTIKEVKDAKVKKTHDRDKLFAAETPQCAKYHILKKALKNAASKQLVATDEAMLLEAIDQPIAHIIASPDNIKITKPSDLQALRSILGETPDNFRVGLGQDSHLFSEEEKGLTIAGIHIPEEPKLEADSDGDVILHAIFNGISQAIGDMSLGFYADEICKNGEKDSKKYLEIVLKKLKKQKLKVNSLGLMVECKTPKIDPLVPKMKKSLSALLDLNTRRIGITATTGENATIFGQGKGIQCFAIVSLVNK